MSSIAQNTLSNVLIWDSYFYFKIYFLKNYKSVFSQSCHALGQELLDHSGMAAVTVPSLPPVPQQSVVLNMLWELRGYIHTCKLKMLGVYFGTKLMKKVKRPYYQSLSF